MEDGIHLHEARAEALGTRARLCPAYDTVGGNVNGGRSLGYRAPAPEAVQPWYQGWVGQGGTATAGQAVGLA
jgi:hypothetical protein